MDPAKRRNKKKHGSGEMDVDGTNAVGPSGSTAEQSQAMDVSETGASSATGVGPLRKVQKGRPMKRSKNSRKMKAVFKAVAQSEKSAEKISKSDKKTMRTNSAKNLYS